MGKGKKSRRFKLQQWVSVLWLLSAPLFIRYFIPSEQISNAQLCQKHSTASTVSIEIATSIFAILCLNMLVQFGCNVQLNVIAISSFSQHRFSSAFHKWEFPYIFTFRRIISDNPGCCSTSIIQAIYFNLTELCLPEKNSANYHRSASLSRANMECKLHFDQSTQKKNTPRGTAKLIRWIKWNMPLMW